MSFFGTEIWIFQIDIKCRNLSDKPFFWNIEEKKSVARNSRILLHPSTLFDPFRFRNRHVSNMDGPLLA